MTGNERSAPTGSSAPTVVDEGVHCARCGSSMDFDVDAGERGLWRCLSDLEWCQANPREGREDVEARWTPEFFEVLGDGTIRTEVKA
jgi:hypothetical protein